MGHGCHKLDKLDHTLLQGVQKIGVHIMNWVNLVIAGAVIYGIYYVYKKYIYKKVEMMAFSIDSIGHWCASHWYIFLIAFILYFVWNKWLKGGKKPIIISREKIEKERRIKELKYNGTFVTIIKKILVPKHTPIGLVEVEDIEEISVKKAYLWKNPKEIMGNIYNIYHRYDQTIGKNVYEIIFKPSWAGSFLFANPFSKKDIIRIFEDDFEPIDKESKNLILNVKKSTDGHVGEYYTTGKEKENVNWINDQIFKHDKEANSSFYEVESQKRATFDIYTAGQLDMKEKEIQAEMARKKGFTERV